MLPSLALCRLISELRIEGDTTRRQITAIGEWKNKAELPGVRKLVMRSEEKRTPPTRDRGIRKERATISDGAPLPPETGEPLPSQQGLPLPPETEEGNPSEGSPFEGNPSKEIPHTQSATGLDEAITGEVVCVSSSNEFLELDQEEQKENPWDTEPWDYDDVNLYVQHCIHMLRHDIRNPPGLVRSILKERDSETWQQIDGVIMDIEIERKKREAAALQRRELERQWEEFQQKQVEQEQKTEAERAEELRRRAEEWERNAPQREQERLDREERERCAALEDCKRYWVQWSNKPKLRDGFISSTLPQDERSRAEFEEWRDSQETTQAATAT